MTKKEKPASNKGKIAFLTDYYADYHKQLIDPIRACLNSAGYGLCVVAGKSMLISTEDQHARLHENAVYDIIQRANLDGVILDTGTVCCGMPDDEFSQFAAGFGQTPLVCIGVEEPQHDSIVLDNALGMHECLDYLLDCHSSDVFMFIGGRRNNPDSMERESVFRERITASGRQLDESLIVYGEYLASKTYQLVIDLIPKRPDVKTIVCTNDDTALGVLAALDVLGISVPNDIRVCGYDDSFNATNSIPTLSSVNQPHYEIAERACTLLLDRICGDQSPRKLEVVPTQFIGRESTALQASKIKPASEFSYEVQIDQVTKLTDAIVNSLRQPSTGSAIPDAELRHCLRSAAMGDATPFEQQLQHRFKKTGLSRYDLHWWQNLLVAIDDRANSLPPSDACDKLQLTLQSSTTAIGFGIRKHMNRMDFDRQRLTQITDYFVERTSSFQSVQAVCAALSDYLNSLNIARCFFAVHDVPAYSVSASTSLVLCRTQGIDRDITEKESFPTQQILPKQFQNHLNDGLLVLHPIQSSGVQFGYLLTDPTGAPAQLEFDHMVYAIGKAMHLMMQLSQMQQSTDELKHANQQLTTLANYDELTNLPNRTLFQSTITGVLDAAAKNDDEVALMFIDLDGFKLINDTLGHDAGDDLLKIVANRLVKVVGENTRISRLGGDEFTVTLQANSDVLSVAEKTVESILKSLSEPYKLSQIVVSISASIGIACFPLHANSVENLMRKADTAMYHAKASGKNCSRVYTEQLDAKFAFQLEQDQKMREGLSKKEFLLYYQPKYCLATNEMVGLEALIRWKQDTNSEDLVPPDLFIPIAERTGFITALDQYTLDTACRFIRQCMDEGYPLPVAVNMSAVQFCQPKFVGYVSDCIQHHDIDPALLELEITETVAMDNVDVSIAKLTELRDLGVKLSIDDFGTGYSSLSYLKELPVDALKIDRAFIKGIGCANSGEADHAIVLAIMALGNTMGFKIIAEGIEYEDQIGILRDMGCHEGQGFYLARPMPEADIVMLCRSNVTKRAA